MTSSADTAASLYYQANQSMADRQFAQAEHYYLQALQQAPELAEAYANLAWLRAAQGRVEEAEQDYRQAWRLAPDNLQIILNFAVMLAALKRFDEAELAYRHVLALDASNLPGLSNLGVLLASVGREDEAETCYRQALTLAPDYRKAAYNLAYLLLRQGRYEEGWRRLEARDGMDLQLDFFCRQHALPRWQGEALAGKAIILVFEFGHGDMLQFVRYARLLKEAGAAIVSCLCHPALQSLLASMPELDAVLALNDPAIHTHVSTLDYWVPLFSLPGLFHTRLDTIPAQLPYLQTDPARQAQWASLLAQGATQPVAKLRAGLVWQGNPRFDNDRERSIHDLFVLQALDVAGVQWFSLQKRTDGTPAAATPLAMTDLSAQLTDFADTAALIMQLDLVVSIDSAVAHLAAALGKPCWLLLPAYQPDWRWLKDREDSPWYPKVMRLFRQPAIGDWGTVMQEVRQGLLGLVTLVDHTTLQNRSIDMD